MFCCRDALQNRQEPVYSHIGPARVDSNQPDFPESLSFRTDARQVDMRKLHMLLLPWLGPNKYVLGAGTHVCASRKAARPRASGTFETRY